MLKEAEIIRQLKESFVAPKGIIGIGDDAAVLPFSETESYVVTKDILVENRHFRLSTSDAASLAHKALHVNLSDVAAMGATPLFALLGIALPKSLSESWVADFLKHFSEGCHKQNVLLIGGDTTGSERDVFISVTMIGRAEKQHLKFRSRAKVGDKIYVAGPLGEAHAGFVALETNTAGLRAVKVKGFAPSALIAEGLWLGTQAGVNAMMDVSDGLYVDLEKLAQASKACAVVDLESLQATPLLTDACNVLRLDTRNCMLTGGEDYALLFTVAAEAAEKLAEDFATKFGYPLMMIGEINAGQKVELRDAGKPLAFTGRSFSHFGEL